MKNRSIRKFRYNVQTGKLDTLTLKDNAKNADVFPLNADELIKGFAGSMIAIPTVNELIKSSKSKSIKITELLSKEKLLYFLAGISGFGLGYEVGKPKSPDISELFPELENPKKWKPITVDFTRKRVQVLAYLYETLTKARAEGKIKFNALDSIFVRRSTLGLTTLLINDNFTNDNSSILKYTINEHQWLTEFDKFGHVGMPYSLCEDKK